MRNHRIINESGAGSRTRLLVGVAVLALGAVSLAGCGSDDKASSSSTIKIMVEGPITGPVYALPEMVTAASAAVKRVNAEGGINGKKLELVVCDEQGNPNKAAECGRKAVPEGIAAVVGGLSTYDNRFIPALEAAKIPYIGAADQLPIDHTSPVAFPILSTAFNYLAGAEALARTGCKKAAIMVADQPGSDDSVGFMKTGLAKAGIEDVPVYKYANSTTDYSALIATATAGGTECIEMAAGPQQLAGILLAVKKAGVKIPMYVSSTAVTAALLEPIDFPAGQLLASGPYYLPGSEAGPEADKALDQFVADMKGMNKTGAAASINVLALNSYSTTLMFADLAKGLDEVTGPNVLKAMATYKSPLPFTGPLDFGGKPALASHPQVHANVSITYTWDGTKLKAHGEPIVVQ